MKSIMKNESNTGGSRHAIRKGCAFALGAVLLFASAAHAESNCTAATKSPQGKWVSQCPTGPSSGQVYVWVVDKWVLDRCYFEVAGSDWRFSYDFRTQLYSMQDKADNPDNVLYVFQHWGDQPITYSDYMDKASEALKSLIARLEERDPFNFFPNDFRVDYCHGYYAMNLDYINNFGINVPILTNSTCPR